MAPCGNVKVRSDISKVFIKVQWRSCLINQFQTRQKEYANSCLFQYFPSQIPKTELLFLCEFPVKKKNLSNLALNHLFRCDMMEIKQQRKEGASSSSLFLLDIKCVWGRNELFHMSQSSYFLHGSNAGCTKRFIKGGFVFRGTQLSTQNHFIRCHWIPRVQPPSLRQGLQFLKNTHRWRGGGGKKNVG